MKSLADFVGFIFMFLAMFAGSLTTYAWLLAVILAVAGEWHYALLCAAIPLLVTIIVAAMAHICFCISDGSNFIGLLSGLEEGGS